MPIDAPRPATHSSSTGITASGATPPTWEPQSLTGLSLRELQEKIRDAAPQTLRSVPMQTRVALTERLLDAWRISYDSEAAVVRLVEAAPKQTLFALDDAGLLHKLLHAIDDHHRNVNAHVFDDAPSSRQLWQMLINQALADVHDDPVGEARLARLLADFDNLATVSHRKADTAKIVQRHNDAHRAPATAQALSLPKARGIAASAPGAMQPTRRDVAERVAAIRQLVDRADGADLRKAHQKTIVDLIAEDPRTTIPALAEAGIFGVVYRVVDGKHFSRLVDVAAASVANDPHALEDFVAIFSLAEDSLDMTSARKAEIETTLRRRAAKQPDRPFADTASAVGRGLLGIVNAKYRR